MEHVKRTRGASVDQYYYNCFFFKYSVQATEILVDDIWCTKAF